MYSVIIADLYIRFKSQNIIYIAFLQLLHFVAAKICKYVVQKMEKLQHTHQQISETLFCALEPQTQRRVSGLKKKYYRLISVDKT